MSSYYEKAPIMGSFITIDVNAGENTVFDKISAGATCEVRRERLDVGDIRIVTEHCTVIVERKHVSDLISSIRDGRYKVSLVLLDD